MWQRVYVIYKEASTISQLKTDLWSLNIMDFSIRVHPLNLSQEEYEDHKVYSLKLTSLPFDITQHDLQHIVEDTQAKSYYILRNNKSYKNLLLTILAFDSNNHAHTAYEKNYSLKGCKLY